MRISVSLLAYSWYKIGPNGVKNELKAGQQLTIESISSGTSGKYIAIVANKYGESTCTYDVTITGNYKPNIINII